MNHIRKVSFALTSVFGLAALLRPDSTIASPVAESGQSIAAATAQAQPRPTMAASRVQSTTPHSPSKSFCELAASARAAGRPTAASLQQRCNAERAAHPALAAPAPAPAGSYAPVRAPHDLVIGRISYIQDDKQVAQPVMGKPVVIACDYIVDEVASPFNFSIHPWQGLILIGGQVSQTIPFRGDPRGGQHEARQLWTPAIAGKTQISCVLNQGFESAEAKGGNNRRDDTIIVISGDPPAPVAEDAAAPPAGADVPPPPAGADVPPPPAGADVSPPPAGADVPPPPAGADVPPPPAQ